MSKPSSGSCLLYAGRRADSKQVSSALILGSIKHPVLTSPITFRHLIGRFACTHLPEPHLPRSCRDFSQTLTTLALYQRSFRWFEACSCKPAPRGLPSSLTQLRTLILQMCTRGALNSRYIIQPSEKRSCILTFLESQNSSFV
jgi:hypothetical protein